MTAEIAPPVSFDPQDLLRKADAARGPRRRRQYHRWRRCPCAYGRAAPPEPLIDAGIEPILQLTCRDKNRIALQSELMGAAALNIRNFLILTGDDPKAGDQPDTKPVFDIDFEDAHRNRAPAARRRHAPHRPRGRGQGKCSPSAPPICQSIRRPAGNRKALLGKVEAGAQFAQTQFCMDAAIVRRYVGALSPAGLTE